jgi:large subunit ribosomal protein L13
MATYFQTREEALKGRKWYVLDASGVPLGRLATAAANLIRGKTLPVFTPHVDGGGFVVVINASSVKLTGRKATDKLYQRHTAYPGGLKTKTAGELRDNCPDKLIRLAVKGMLPKGRLGHQLCGKLKVYAGAEHPHKAQMPEVYSLGRAAAAKD